MANQRYTGEDSTPRGWILHDERITPANLWSSESSFGEVGPRAAGAGEPGRSTAAVVEAIGDQDTAITVEAFNGGLPRLDSGATFGWRPTSAPASEVRGWQAPNAITGVRSPIWDTTERRYIGINRFSDGRLVAGWRQGPSGTLQLRRYDPTTNAWTVMGVPIVANLGAVAFAVDADDRILVFAEDTAEVAWNLYRSLAPYTGDSGFERILTSSPGLFGSASLNKLRLFFLPSGDACLFAIFTSKIEQYASSDGGATWVEVVEYSTGAGSGGSDAFLLPGGRIGLVQLGSAAGSIAYFRSGDAWTPIPGAGGTSIATNRSEAWGAADLDGQIWVWVRGASASPDQLTAYTSQDAGSSWQSYGLVAQLNADLDNYPTLGQACFGLGEFYLFHKFVAPLITQDIAAPILTRLGGWSTLTSYGNASSGGLPPGTGMQGSIWWPIGEPDQMPCWAIISGVDAADTITIAGRLQISTAGDTRQFANFPVTGTDQGWQTAEWEAAVTSSGPAGTYIASARGALSNGALGSLWDVALRPDGFRVSDSSAVVATVAVDLTSPMQFRVAHRRNSRVEVFYRRPFDQVWTLAISFAVATSAAITSGYMFWGHQTLSASTCVSLWSYLYTYTFENTLVTGIIGSRASALPGQVSAFRGHALSGTGTPLPLLAAPTAGEGTRVVSIRGLDGPALAGDTWSLAPNYDYPVGALHPTVQPSPRRPWRSTTATNQIAWDFGDRAFVGQYVGLAVYGANVPQVTLQGHNGTSWVTLGTLNLRSDFLGLTFTRTGRVLRANSATPPRYVWRHELVGAVAESNLGAVGRIVRHTEGVWSTAAGKATEIEIEDATGWAASGTLAIRATSGVLVVRAPGGPWRGFRVQIPSSSYPDGYAQIGTIVLGEPVVAGQSHSWGGSQVYDPNASTSVSRDGVPRARRLGPAIRTWSWAWSDGVDQSRLLDATPTPDYLAWEAVTAGIANLNDAPYLVAGMLEDTRSGELPIVACEEMRLGSLVDPRLHMLARLTSSVGIEHIQGDFESDVVVRVSPLTMREIV